MGIFIASDIYEMSQDDYEVFEEAVQEQVEEVDEDYDKKESYVGDSISIVTKSEGFVGNFDDVEVYNIDGSDLFIVDEESKTALHFVSPIPLDNLRELKEYVGYNERGNEKLVYDDEYKSIKLFRPNLMYLVE